jgi:hypothetical protein
MNDPLDGFRQILINPTATDPEVSDRTAVPGRSVVY